MLQSGLVDEPAKYPSKAEPYDPTNFLYLRNPDDGLDKLRDLLIDELNLTTRVYNSLSRSDIDTVGELLEYTEQDLQDLRSFGRKSLEEVKRKLAYLGSAGLHLAVYDKSFTPPPNYEWAWSREYEDWRLRRIEKIS